MSNDDNLSNFLLDGNLQVLDPDRGNSMPSQVRHSLLLKGFGSSILRKQQKHFFSLAFLDPLSLILRIYVTKRCCHAFERS